MMAAFLKNGERVRVARNNGGEIYNHLIGQTGTILDYPPFNLQALVQMDDGSFEYFWPSELERVEDGTNTAIAEDW